MDEGSLLRVLNSLSADEIRRLKRELVLKGLVKTGVSRPPS